MSSKQSGWQFWIDRGGTFTDVVARRPDGGTVTRKLLSEHAQRYDDAAIQGIRDVLGVADDEPLPVERIDSVRMGTTVATNALLERAGEPTVLVTTSGFGDALRIGYQNRPDLFALDIVVPEQVYEQVIEIDERMGAHGEVVRPLDEEAARVALARARDDGFDSAAIALLHGYRHVDHERRVARIARALGFAQVSVSHEVSPLMKLVSRANTTVVDAYLSPILRSYVGRVESRLRPQGVGPRPHLFFMQSNGGLTVADRFRGKDALLSGPAGGVVGMIRTAVAAGFDRLIGFDMGGTSTDVSHHAGVLERTSESEIAGVRVRAPMIDIHTVAAGGGSILHFDGSRLRVGPQSAGADPGPAAYGNGGPLTITDCNVVLGKLQPDLFPAVFGADGDRPLDGQAARNRFVVRRDEVAAATGTVPTVEHLAEGYLSIAVENMANAIKRISVQRGHDVTTYTLACFGGAGGQHACLVADRLGIERVHIHPHAGVLSAVGIGLADVLEVADEAVEAPLDDAVFVTLGERWTRLETAGRRALEDQGIPPERIETHRRLRLRYAGSDTALLVDAGDRAELLAAFEEAHRARFGFATPDVALVVDSLQVEAIGATESVVDARPAPKGDPDLGSRSVVMAGVRHDTPFLDRSVLPSGRAIDGPAVLVEETGTTIVEPGWRATVTATGDLVLERVVPLPDRVALGTGVDPVQLEIFDNLFMNIAEQMGVVLENTAASVNIKERLDFSCAVFDPAGELVANAPHMPVHLGSMSESVRSIIRHNPDMDPGDVYAMNAPYDGGTHLPDVTVVKPVFGPGDEGGSGEIIFFLASRGHHADIGGTAPGSAPAGSTSVEEEGVLLDNVVLVRAGRFFDAEVRALLTAGPHPARKPDQNIADLKAQVAACEKGAEELQRVVGRYGLEVVHAYMGHVMDNAEESVRRVIDTLHDGSFVAEMDDGHRVAVTISVDRAARRARIDFTGTSATHPGNFNAPSSIVRAAVLYVFRCLVDDDIPLNSGCMKPLDIVLPNDSMIDPSYPAAVFAGNVETSQLIVDTLFGALGVMGAAQGSMNNVIWGNERHQYYETIGGGAGATAHADGASAVHTHMTNSRLTDPEVLEWRFPVRVDHFGIRRGSGGAGRHRGGDGVVRRVRFDEPMELNVVSSRRRVPPYGMAGGASGSVGHNRVIRTDGTVEEFGATVQTMVSRGDVFEIETPGGGGYGDPSG